MARTSSPAFSRWNFTILLHAALRERTVTSILKERGGGRGAEPPNAIESEELFYTFLGLIIERHHPAARAFRDGGGQMRETDGAGH